MKQLTIQLFARLKDFFPPTVEIELSEAATTHDVLEVLKKQEPQAAIVLDNCRVAVGEDIVSPDYTPVTNDIIFILPPSSGG